MMEDFSGGYYRTKMSVQPVESGPTIERGLHDFIRREYYSETTAPITMRLGFSNSAHFRPDYESAIPTDVLALPPELCEEADIGQSAEDVSVLILKPGHAHLFAQTRKHRYNFENSRHISDTSLSEKDRQFFNLESSDSDNDSDNKRGM